MRDSEKQRIVQLANSITGIISSRTVLVASCTCGNYYADSLQSHYMDRDELADDMRAHGWVVEQKGKMYLCYCPPCVKKERG